MFTRPSKPGTFTETPSAPSLAEIETFGVLLLLVAADLHLAAGQHQRRQGQQQNSPTPGSQHRPSPSSPPAIQLTVLYI
jgi:hypothetical protein